MATQRFINELKNRANANRLGRFGLQVYDREEKEFKGDTLQDGTPTPDTPVEIQSVTGLQNINVCGKNLLDIATIYGNQQSYNLNIGVDLRVQQKNTNGSYSVSGNDLLFTINASWEYAIVYLIPVNTNTNYYLSCDTRQTNLRTSFYELDKDYKILTKKVEQGGLPTGSITTGANTKYLALSISANTTGTLTISNIQLEQGSTATEYEPYKGITYEVNLGKNLYEGSQDFSGTWNNASSWETDTETYNNLVVKKRSGTWNGISKTLNIEAGKTYTFSFYVKADSNRNFDIYISSGGTATISLPVLYNKTATSTWQRMSATFTCSVSGTIKPRIENNSTSSGNYTYICGYQLEEGQLTDYAPYFTPIELNKIGDYQDSIKKSTGKNLFDKSTIIEGKYIDGNGVIQNDPGNFLGDFISIDNTKSYYVSSNTTSAKRIGYYNSNKEYISREVLGVRSSILTIPNNAKYVRLSCYNDNLSTLQLELGTQQTSYEPYGKVWYVEKKIGKLVLDGNSNIKVQEIIASNNKFVWRYLDELNMAGSGSRGNILSNYYTGNINVYGANDLIGAYVNGANLTNFATLLSTIGATTSTSTTQALSLLQTWLNNNNVIMLYPLATPTYEVITNEELINQLESIELLKGENNITITSEDLPVIFEYSFWNGDIEVDEDERFLDINQSNYLSKIELKDSCYVNDTIIGSIYTQSAEVELLDLPVDTKLVSKKITPQIGVRYSDNSTEYETFDNYTIESVNDEQTASNTKFTAMNGGTELDKEYVCSLSFENGATHTIYEFYEDACSQIGLTPTDASFDNGTLVMTGNPFTNKETIRVVLSEVEKVSCSLIDFDWKNKTISLTWLSDQIDYEFNTSDYSTLEGSLTQYGPLNSIIIANAQLDGENVVMEDSESIALYGEHQIVIDSPYFLYTEALRREAIQAIYDKLDGLKYYDLKLTTPYGKPFLKIGNKIRINTNEGQTYDTYVLTHTLTYDGAIGSVIESPALTSEEQTIKNSFKQSSIKEKMQRTEVIVNKVTGDVTALTERVVVAEDGLGNVYSKDQVNTLIQNAETGVTNTFSEAGGNNIFRNTGLFFENNGTDKNENPYEFWIGKVVKTKETKASNMNALLLQNGSVYQEQIVPNGNYTISFKYKKLIELSNLSVFINDEEIQLTEVDDTNFEKSIEVTSQHINIRFVCDIDNGCEIYDLMVNAGSVALAYSQNQNEVTTDTVNISKGIEINSSQTNTKFRADSDGVRVLNKDSNEEKTKFLDTGMETEEATIKNRATIVKTLFQEVGNHTWITRL